MPNWTHEYEPLELTVEGDDFISELAAAEVERRRAGAVVAGRQLREQQQRKQAAHQPDTTAHRQTLRTTGAPIKASSPCSRVNS